MERIIYPNIINIDNKIFDFTKNTYVMGIINITSDSFFDGGKYLNKENALFRTEKILKEGADIIDLGGESTRPGSKPISIDEELNRVIPVLKEIKKNFDAVISVDTTKAVVAKNALEHGASIINDISGLNFEPEIAEHVSANKAAIVLMHTTSRPIDMQKSIYYESLIDDILEILKKSIQLALNKGIDKEKIIIDPGIGFGKTVDDNIEIIKELNKFKKLGCPILIGTSRKSFIGKILGDLNVNERLIGSVSTAVLSAINGASIVRVHDVKETKQALKIIDTIYKH